MAKAVKKKDAKTASNIFHKIMAASVKGNPKPTSTNYESINIHLEKENRSGYYNIIDDILTINENKINGKLYKVVLGAGYGTQETFNLYKDDKGVWVKNMLYESIPALYDSIRTEIDKIEN